MISKNETDDLFIAWYYPIFLGLLTVFPGAANGWGMMLRFGFREGLFVAFLMGPAFIILHLCVAEMTSILPFSGGAYGFVRVTLGPYMGYLVGFLESLHTLTFPAYLINLHGTAVANFIGGSASRFLPLICFTIYGIVLLLNSGSRKLFWNFTAVGGFIAVLLMSLYLILSAYNINEDPYPYYDQDDKFFAGGFPEFLSLLPMPSIIYRGVELLPLSCNEISQPKRVMPINIMILSIFIFIFLIGVIFAGPAQYPGIDHLGSEEPAAKYAYVNAFKMKEGMAHAISAIPSLFTDVILVYLLSKQLQAIALSGLLPDFLEKKRMNYSTPHYAAICGSIVGFILCIFNIYVHKLLLFIFVLVGLTGFYFTGISIFISFIILRVKFSSLEREFRNPLGIGSAVYGLVLFIFGAVGMVGFQEGRIIVSTIFVLIIALASLFYYFVARFNQHFSPEEESILFVLYVMKANSNKRKRMNHHHHKLISRSESYQVSTASQSTGSSVFGEIKEKPTKKGLNLSSSNFFQGTKVAPISQDVIESLEDPEDET